MDEKSFFLSFSFDSLRWKPPLLFRSMHYPPETSSIMLMARMVAVVKQVRHFTDLSSAPIQPETLQEFQWRSEARRPHCGDAVLLLNVVFVAKAKDKDHWQKLFSRFCSRAANEEEEMAHKLLGEQFRVSLPPGHVCLSCARVDVPAAPRANPGIAAPSGGAVIPPVPLSSFSPSSRGSWPCYTTFSKQHFMMTISVG